MRKKIYIYQGLENTFSSISVQLTLKINFNIFLEYIHIYSSRSVIFFMFLKKKASSAYQSCINLINNAEQNPVKLWNIFCKFEKWFSTLTYCKTQFIPVIKAEFSASLLQSSEIILIFWFVWCVCFRWPDGSTGPEVWPVCSEVHMWPVIPSLCSSCSSMSTAVTGNSIHRCIIYCHRSTARQYSESPLLML